MAERTRAGASAAAAAAVEPPLDPRAVLTSLGEVVYDWDIASDRLVWGLNVRDVLGLGSRQPLATGRAFAALIEPGSGESRHDAILAAREDAAANGTAYRARYGLRTPARVLFIEDSGRWFGGADNRPAFAHGVLRVEPTPVAAHAAEAGEARGGVRDRAGVVVEIAAALAASGRQRPSLTLIVAEIEGLAQIDSGIGYEAADAVVAVVVARLMSTMRRRDLLARYAGNRFCLVLNACSAEQARIAGRRFSHAVERAPIETPQGPVAAKLRLGAVTAPEHDKDAAELLRHAEAAMAEARRGGAGLVSYSPGLASMGRRGAPGAGLDLVAALNARRLRIARQPIIDARTRVVVFEEVLMRLERPNGGFATASEIVPTAERTGLVPLIDHRVLELAVAVLSREPATRLAINVSVATLRDVDWLPAFAAQLGAYPDVADRLIVEVTETAAVDNPDALRASLTAMKALGAGIAIDDFGSGHTSFRHLRNFPVDIVKIDGAFIQNLARSADDRFFVRTLVDLAQHLGLATVAEWVDSEESARLLAAWGVDFLQGEAIGAPVIEGQKMPAPKLA